MKRLKDKKIKDNEQDAENIQWTTKIEKGAGGRCHQDLLIYYTQWFIDLDECLIAGATLVLDDLGTWDTFWDWSFFRLLLGFVKPELRPLWLASGLWSNACLLEHHLKKLLLLMISTEKVTTIYDTKLVTNRFCCRFNLLSKCLIGLFVNLLSRLPFLLQMTELN